MKKISVSEIKEFPDLDLLEFSKDTTQDHIDIKNGDLVQIYESGIVAAVKLKFDTLAKGFLFRKDTFLVFYPTGELYYGYLAGNQRAEVQGTKVKIRVQFKNDSTLHFHKNGSISQGNNIHRIDLPEPYKFRLVPGPVVFDGSGQLINCVCDQSLSLKNDNGDKALTKADSFIGLTGNSENPSLTEVILKADSKWNNFVIESDKRVLFYNGTSMSVPGEIRSFFSVYHMYYRNHFIGNSEPIELFESGALKSFSISYEMSINNIDLKPNRTILGLFENGNIRSLFSTWDITIKGVVYPKGTNIYFNENGDVIK